jgi:geranylgeranyl diphosphate synthase type I
VTGDILYALANSLLLSVDEKTERKEKAFLKFSDNAAFTGIGEYIDIVNGLKTLDKIREKDILLTYDLKTAKYTFEFPLVIGAELAGAAAKELKKISAIAAAVGQAFQITDDLLDVFSSSDKTGKPALSDLAEGKKTLLVWRTYQKLGVKEKKRFKNLLEKDKRTLKDLAEMKELIIRSGAKKYCERTASSLLKKAAKICPFLEMKPEYRTILEKFIKNLRSRAVIET